MADGARVGAPAAREAQPSVRVLVVLARALLWQRLAHDQPELLGLVDVFLAQLPTQGPVCWASQRVDIRRQDARR